MSVFFPMDGVFPRIITNRYQFGIITGMSTIIKLQYIDN